MFGLRNINGGVPAHRLQEQMDNLFSEVFAPLAGVSPFAVAARDAQTFPAMNLWEDGDNLYVEAELPGQKLDDLEITLHGHDLTLRGERKGVEGENVTYHRRERGFGTFTRTLHLPVLVDADKVEAKLMHGVLQLTLPKAPEAKARKIDVKVA